MTQNQAFANFLRWAEKHRTGHPTLARQMAICRQHIWALRRNRNRHPLTIQAAAKDFAELERMLG